jgi:hypothetical protein
MFINYLKALTLSALAFGISNSLYSSEPDRLAEFRKQVEQVRQEQAKLKREQAKPTVTTTPLAGFRKQVEQVKQEQAKLKQEANPTVTAQTKTTQTQQPGRERMLLGMGERRAGQTGPSTTEATSTTGRYQGTENPRESGSFYIGDEPL